MTAIVVPRVNANDDTCVLVTWLVQEQATVAIDTPVAVVETAKASVEITAEAEGVIVRIGAEGEDYAIGAVIGRICRDVKEAQQISAGLHEVGPTADEVVVTEPARLLAQERGIPDSVLRSLGKAVVRTEDVRALAGVQNTDEAKRNKRQQAVAEMVTRSHDIPAAHLTTKIFLDADLDDGPLGHVPRVVRAVTTARKTGSDVFGWYDEGRFTPAPSESVVGITVDLGTGLWVPVLRDVERLSLEDISESILEFGYKAVKERFDAVDLEGGQFTVSLPVGNGMHTSVAMILPPQVAILALGDPVNEVVPGPDGSVRTATFVDATLSYDHRVVNGREAAEFLAAVRESIENPRNHYRG